MGKRGKERGEKASLRERGRSDGVKVTGGGKGQSPGHTREVGLYKVGGCIAISSYEVATLVEWESGSGLRRRDALTGLLLYFQSWPQSRQAAAATL